MRKQVLLLLTLFLAPIVSAQPIINSVSGDLSHGTQLTISGSIFGSSPIPHIIAWDDFDDGVLGNPITDTPKIGSWGYTNEGGDGPPVYANNCYRGLCTYYSKNGGFRTNPAVPLDPNKNKYYISYRYKFDVPDFGIVGAPGQVKLWQLWGNAETWDYDPGLMSGCEVYGWCYTWLENDDGGGVIQQTSFGGVSTNQWQHFEGILKQSSPNIADGSTTLKLDGNTIYDLQNIKTRIQPTSNWEQIKTFYGFTNTNGFNYNSLDDIYVAASWARIEIGNSPTYESSTKRQIQIPSSWTSNDIIIEVSLGDFTQQEIDNGLYLFVIDENGQTSDGYSLSSLNQFPILIDFDSSNQVTESGYISFTPQVYNSNRGYGWIGSAPNSYYDQDNQLYNQPYGPIHFDYGGQLSLLRDCHYGSGTFAIDLPNGDYRVSFAGVKLVSLNAPWAFNPPVTVEGYTFDNLMRIADNVGSTVNKDRWSTLTVKITDGQLNIGSSSNFPLCALEIEQINKPDPQNFIGDFIEGSTVTIQGNNFGTKVPVAPTVWDDFERGPQGGMITENSVWSPYYFDQNLNPRFSTNAYSGQFSAGNHDPGFNGFHTATTTLPNIKTAYTNYKFLATGAANSCGNQKKSRITSINQYGGTDYSGVGEIGNSEGDVNFNNGDLTRLSSDSTGQGFLVDYPNDYEWNTVELFAKVGTPYEYDGFIGHYLNSKLYGYDIKSPTGGGLCTVVATGQQETCDFSFNSYIMGLMQANCPARDGIYMDNVYIDNTIKRVEVCNTNDWLEKEANGAHCEIQIPQNTWNNNNIEIKVNRGTFTDQDIQNGLYLFVIDENNIASDGYQIPIAENPNPGTPFISSVPSLSHDNTVTITGFDFGSKPRISEVVFDDLEDGFDLIWTDRQRTTRITTALNDLTLASDSRHQFSSQSATYDFGQGGSAGYFTGNNGILSDKWFVQYWFRTQDFEWGTEYNYQVPGGDLANVKIFRMWNPGSVDENFVMATNGGSTVSCDPEYIDGDPGCTSRWGNKYDWIDGNWHLLEFEYKESDVGVANGYIKAWFDGELQLNSQGRMFREDFSQLKRPFIVGFYDSWWSGVTDSDILYLDDVISDPSFARIMLCPGSSWDNRGQCEVQIPISWSDSSITFTAKQNALPDGIAYLYVVDQNGVVSPAKEVIIQSGVQNPCGNGRIDSGEECDGSDLGGESCTSINQGFLSGTLACNSQCEFDTSDCSVFIPDPSTEIIIDNGQTGTSKSGTWYTGGSSFAGFYGTDYEYSSNDAGNTYNWQTDLLPGNYEIGFSWSTNNGRPNDNTLNIYVDGILVDTQNNNQQISDNGFFSLGTFAVNNNARIELIGSNSTEGTSADAVRFTKTSDLNTEPNYDLNNDGSINLEDLYELATNFGTNYAQGDYDNDNKITIIDIITHINNWN